MKMALLKTLDDIGTNNKFIKYKFIFIFIIYIIGRYIINVKKLKLKIKMSIQNTLKDFENIKV